MTSDSSSVEQSYSDSGPQVWDPKIHCRSVESFEIRMSRGFLRSAPSRWFPGLNSHWLPLLLSTGLEFKVLDVSPQLVLSMPDNSHIPSNLQNGGLEPIGAWFIDDEPVGLYAESSAKAALIQAFIPNSSRFARKTLLEYLSRRIAISLQASWSGVDSSELIYDSEFQISSFSPQAWIRVKVLLNNERLIFAFGIGKILADKLDGLWRRQLKPTNISPLLSKHQKQGSNQIRLELAKLAVAPHSLPSYLKTGNIIDLEIPLSSSISLKLGEESWLSASLCRSAGRFCIETNSLSPNIFHVSEGATPLSIDFGSINLDSNLCSELEQVGAIVETDLPLSDIVQLSIRGEKVGKARLVRFEGRFAIQVI